MSRPAVDAGLEWEVLPSILRVRRLCQALTRILTNDPVRTVARMASALNLPRARRYNHGAELARTPGAHRSAGPGPPSFDRLVDGDPCMPSAPLLRALPVMFL